MNNRAYSILDIKSSDDDKRIVTGIATTPQTDRDGDIIEPMGAEFVLPIPFLWQHDAKNPVGHVTKAKVTSAGIEVEIQLMKTDVPGLVKDRLDAAWQDIKLKLVRGLSIGFLTLESARIEGTWGHRVTRWEWVELSGVTIASNAPATITSIKKFDAEALAASGRRGAGVVPPVDEGNRKAVKVTVGKTQSPKEGRMKTTSQRIAEYQEARKQKALKMGQIIEAAGDETLIGDQAEEFDTLSAEVKALDNQIIRLTDLEAMTSGQTAKVVGQVNNAQDGSLARTPGVQVKAVPKLAPGIGFAQIVKAKAMGFKARIADEIAAERMYGSDSHVAHILKAAVVAGTNNSSNWAGDLTGTSSQVYADFAEYLRPQTILGKFGQGGIPSLRNVPFRTRLVLGTGGGSGYWVGEGKPKPLTAFDFDQSVLDPLKVANICVLSMENVRDSSPSSDLIVRDELVKALAFRLDTDFINPAKAAVSNVSPASITNGVSGTNASGTDADAVRADLAVLLNAYIAADNPPLSGVIIMSAKMAMTIGLMRNSLGQKEFPDISMSGGFLEGFPVIASQYVPTVTAGTYMFLVNAQDIYLGDEGGYTIDVSTEASLEMLDGSLTQDATAGTGASLVSLWQTNSIGILAERTINWKKRRASAVQTIKQVAYAV